MTPERIAELRMWSPPPQPDSGPDDGRRVWHGLLDEIERLRALAPKWEMGDAAAALNAAELGDGFAVVAVRYENGTTAVREANMGDLDSIISDVADWPFGGATVYAFAPSWPDPPGVGSGT